MNARILPNHLVSKFIRLYKVRKYKNSYDKCVTFYKNICRAHRKYPRVIEHLIRNVEQWGYYKYLFRLLEHSKSKKLTKFLYTFIHKKIMQDKANHDKGEKVSTLVKWMPREKKYFDREYDFVTKFSQMMYPDIEINSAKKRYRKFLSSLQVNKHVNVIEEAICSGNYEVIKFENMPFTPFNKYFNTFVTNDVLKPRLERFLTDKYAKMTLFELINQSRKPIHSYEKEIMDAVVTQYVSVYTEEITQQLDTTYAGNFNLLIDVTKDAFQTHYMNHMVAMVVISHYHKLAIWVNAKEPYQLNLSDSFCDIVETIYEQLSNTTDIYFDKIYDLKEKKRWMVITNKEYEPPKGVYIWRLNKHKLKMEDNHISGYIQKKNKGHMQLRKFINLISESDIRRAQKEERIRQQRQQFWLKVLFAMCVLMGITYYFI